ncbi:MAG: phospholipase D-like domain-containing protein [Candidatus Omnitrophota bacterium]
MNPKTKTRKFLYVLIFFCSCFLPVNCFAEILTGQAYQAAVHKQLSQAEKSITVVMYFIILEPSGQGPINELVADLICAKQRGVVVRVILEDSKLKENRLAYELLRDQGIEVNFDTRDALLHIKAVVIDQRYLFIGSANWSRAAIENNYEVTNFIDSAQDALVFNQYIANIPVQDKDILLPITQGIELSEDFLLLSQLGPRLLKNQAGKQFDLYLLLCKIADDTQQPSLSIDYDALALQMGYKPLNNLGKYRNQHNYFFERIQHSLIRLKRYGLIDYKKNTVGLKTSESAKQIIIPPQYWEYNYPAKLSMRAKYLYLICLSESGRSNCYPVWFRSQKDMSKLYNISDTTISLGLRELEEKGIIEIKRDELNPADFSDRLANVYKMLVLPKQI